MENNKEYWKLQSEQFDKSADYYDKFRPGYPKELVDTIVEQSCLQKGSKVMEIGAGSGKATELFVKKDLNMYCIEPGTSLVEMGKRKFNALGNTVEFCNCRLEDWEELPHHFDAAISAQAFHWVSKPLGFYKIFNALKEDGYMALFWNLYITHNNIIDTELNKTGMFLLQTEEACEARIGRHVQEIRESKCFKEPHIFKFPWKQRYTAEEYIGFMRTGNQYLSADETDRKIAEHKVAEIIDENGGYIERQYLCVLFLAQKMQGQ